MTFSIARPGRAFVPALVLPAAFFLSAAQAQSVPPVDAGKALQEARPVPPPAPKKAAEPLIVQPEERPLALPAGQTLKVDAFRFEGAGFIAEAELQAAVAPYKGRALSMADIEAAADRVTALYRVRGYLVARAHVPRQDASAGTLTVRVVVGKYGKVSVVNQSLVRDPQIGAYFSGLAGDKAVTRDELERAMLLVSDLPGAGMPKVSISPGQAPGSSDFNVEVPAGKPYSAYATLDNYGSRYTGQNRLSVGGSLVSPLHLGDALEFSALGSNASGLLNGRLAYSAPLGSSGLRGELALGSTQYKLGDSYAALDARGYANSLEANASYPILRTRTRNLTATFGLAGREMRDELNSVGQTTTKHVGVGTFGLTFERYDQLFGLDAYFSLGGSVTGGRLDIDEAAMKAANQAGADTVGKYAHANLTAQGRLAITDTFSATLTLAVQRAVHRNLDSSEQMMVSGTRGVLAYQDAVSGDSGYLGGVELRKALPAPAALPGLQHAVSAFADAAHVGLYNASYTTSNGSTLSDVGLAYSASWRMLFARLQALQAIGSWPAGVPVHDRNRFLVQAGTTF